MDRVLLAKILARTASSSDAEALTALRKANELIAAARTSWGEVLGVDRVSPPPRPDPNRYYRPPMRPRPRPAATPAFNMDDVLDTLHSIASDMAYNLGRGLRGQRRRGR